MLEVIQRGRSAVIIQANADGGQFKARLYVNYGDPATYAGRGDATNIAASFSTLGGARRWADRQLSAQQGALT